MTNSTAPGKREYKRSLIALVLLLFVAAHGALPSRFTLDWPAVVLLGLAVCIWWGPRIGALAPFVKRLKVGETEIELREQANALALSVARSEDSAPIVSAEPTPPRQDVAQGEGTAREAPRVSPPDESYERLVDTAVEAHILDLAAKDKQAALMRLAIEIEKEVTLLHGSIGLRNQPGLRSFTGLINQLFLHGTLAKEVRDGLAEFWRVRNQIAHSSLADDSILTSTLDSGLRLLRLVKAAPRPRYAVIIPEVALFKDQDCTDPITEYVGVLLEMTTPGGQKQRMVYPAGRQFVAGENVGWDWDMNRKADAAFYQDPQSNAPRSAWAASMFFVGKREPE